MSGHDDVAIPKVGNDSTTVADESMYETVGDEETCVASRKGRTTTSRFGVNKRESHDASGFYARFAAPVLSNDETVLQPSPVAQPFVCGDSRAMSGVADGSVALVVTSPPYFAGKAYEEELGRDGIPSSYIEYLELLHSVFAECVRTLEPGGRIAVNVANLGRKPFRSLSADIVYILQDQLGLLLRGEIVWRKAEGASGSCAWGSFRSPTNPVFRDTTERVIVASKGRFDRARSTKLRRAEGLPWQNDLATDEFMELTLDMWDIPPESAQRVNHPAPFPVELPEKLINLFTYKDDLVLDPFMGSGSTLVASERLGRRYVGYDLDPAYVDIARERVTQELQSTRTPSATAHSSGAGAFKLAEELLLSAGFKDVTAGHRVRRSGVEISFAANDSCGAKWYFDVAGANTTHRGGMSKTDVVWRTLGRATAVSSQLDGPLVVLTTALARSGTPGDLALRSSGPSALFDVIDVTNTDALLRLSAYAGGEHAGKSLPGFWKT